MPPLRDAVCLIDCKQCDAVGDRAGPSVNLAEQFLGGNVEQFHLALHEQFHRLAVLALAFLAVEGEGRHAILLEGIDLVVHQCQQRRDDDGKTILAHQAGNLVAQ